MNFAELAATAPQLANNKLFLFGLLLIIAGLGFKIAAFPFQIWAPDVYQGAPSPTTAFLAVGSKAAGFALLLRVLFTAVPSVTEQWSHLLIVLSGATILYGNLGAIPQRNLKRLLGYSTSHTLAICCWSRCAIEQGSVSSPLLPQRLPFTVLAAFVVICLVMREVEAEDISALAGLNERSLSSPLR
jgi:NADH-quinone oxidoreductase subunit N